MTPAGTGHEPSHLVEGKNGVVVSVSGPASDAGLSVLKAGGNAVDAAIATAFALAVTYPLAGNIGGGGFMLVHPPPGMGGPVGFDYRETAPAAARHGMYAPEESQYTHRAVATPGTVRGMELAHRRFGSLEWPALLDPAIELATDGFIVDGPLARSVNETLAAAPEHPELQRVYAKPGGGPWQAGDRMILPDLSETLQQLSAGGPNAFYNGSIAGRLAAEMETGGGLITTGDLAAYQAIERTPLSTRYRGLYDVYVPPPASAGGICLLEELNILDAFDLTASTRWSVETIHLMAEVMRRAQYDRDRYPGDTAFVTIPDHLITPGYGRELAATIDVQRATPSESLVRAVGESPDTTHVGVIDRNGMAVANTYTLERRWGSRVVVRGTGILLNNNMRAFDLFPRSGITPNAIEPRKRPLSSMTPTIVARDGRVLLVTGSTGSRAIPNTILNILVSILDFGMSVEEAVRSPRFTHEWMPDHIRMESPEQRPDTVAALESMGHKVVPPTPLPFQGDAHTIRVAADATYIGVADRRISGKASAY